MDFDVMFSYLPFYKEALLLTLRIGWKGVGIACVIGIIGSAILHFKIPIELSRCATACQGCGTVFL